MLSAGGRLVPLLRDLPWSAEPLLQTYSASAPKHGASVAKGESMLSSTSAATTFLAGSVGEFDRVEASCDVSGELCSLSSEEA